MKKIPVFAFVIVLALFVLAACENGGNNIPTNMPADNPAEAATPPTSLAESNNEALEGSNDLNGTWFFVEGMEFINFSGQDFTMGGSWLPFELFNVQEATGTFSVMNSQIEFVLSDGATLVYPFSRTENTITFGDDGWIQFIRLDGDFETFRQARLFGAANPTEDTLFEEIDHPLVGVWEVTDMPDLSDEDIEDAELLSMRLEFNSNGTFAIIDADVRGTWTVIGNRLFTATGGFIYDITGDTLTMETKGIEDESIVKLTRVR